MNYFLFQISRTFVQAATSSFSYVIANQMFNKNRYNYRNSTHHRTHQNSIDNQIHSYKIKRDLNKAREDKYIVDASKDIRKNSSEYLPSSFLVESNKKEIKSDLIPNKRIQNNSIGLIDRIIEKNNL